MVLLGLGDIGNSPQPNFIFFTKTRYASRASICVGNVLLRFVHIFRYLSELVSFRAAYHSPDEDVCFRTIARRLPPSPVTPLVCFRQAAFRSDISVSSSAGSSANEPIPIFDRVPERTGFEGAIFGDEIFGDAIFGDAVFEDVVFEDAVFEDTVFDNTVFDDAVFEDAVFEDVVFEDVAFGDAAFEDEVFEDEVFEDVFEGKVFEDVVFGDAIFGASILGPAVFKGATFDFEGVNFAVTIFEGTPFDGTTAGGAAWLLVGLAGVCEGWN